MYFNPILKDLYSYSSADIIHHNLCLSFFPLIAYILWIFLSQKFHPLRIITQRIKVLLAFTIFLPFLITAAINHTQIFLIQAFLLVFSMTGIPGESVFVTHFPVFKRFTCASIVYALSRAVVYIITAFGLVYVTELFGYYGLWIISIPIILGHLWGVRHFEKLEGLRPYTNSRI